MRFFKSIFRNKDSSTIEQRVSVLLQINEQLVRFLEVSLFKLCSEYVHARYPARFPDRSADPVAARMKRICTGENPDEVSPSATSDEDRRLAEVLADEAMATNASGFYWLPIDMIAPHVKALSCTLESIKSLSLTTARQLALAIAYSATDNTLGMNRPVIDRDRIRSDCLPLLLRVAYYDGNVAVVQTDLAQIYYTLGEIDRGRAAALEANKLDPSNAEAWRLIGNSYMIEGNDPEARRCFEKALTLNPDLDGAREALKLLH